MDLLHGVFVFCIVCICLLQLYEGGPCVIFILQMGIKTLEADLPQVEQLLSGRQDVK